MIDSVVRFARTDPVQYRKDIRLLSALLARANDVIAELAGVPVRTVNIGRVQ